MKLGKLLAAGKSIMNGRTDVSYRSSKQIYLPKFGSPKNPFKGESPAQAEPHVSAAGSTSAHSDQNTSAVQARVVVAPVNCDVPQVSKPAVSPIFKSANYSDANVAYQAKPSIENSPSAASGRSEAKTDGGQGGRFSNLAPRFNPSIPQKQDKDWSKFNPLSILRAALPAGKAARSENMANGQKGTATQTELSLDSVKVVHNDLSDVDVEVVPIKSRASVPELPAPKNSWEFVGERLFGVEAT
jgi:hypothetical protein